MSISKSAGARTIDIAYVLVIASTIGMYVVDRSLSANAAGTQLIIGMAVAKSILIASVFMGLLWSARWTLAAVATSFLALGATLAVVLT